MGKMQLWTKLKHENALLHVVQWLTKCPFPPDLIAVVGGDNKNPHWTVVLGKWRVYFVEFLISIPHTIV